MYFKNNWNAGPFFLLHGYFRRKKTYIFVYSCNTFSRSESGAETTSQTFQFLIDILNQNQVVEQVYTDI
jgi:hypothetical protein